MTGWECPKCGRVWAPSVIECDGHKGEKWYLPKLAWPQSNRCGKCHIDLSGRMGYVCPHPECPTSMGGTRS